VAARKGTELNSHALLKRYAGELAKELADEAIWSDFCTAELLHRNFYNLGFELEEVRGHVDRVREAVDKLVRVAEEPETE
jgi:hypothetical protein